MFLGRAVWIRKIKIEKCFNIKQAFLLIPVDPLWVEPGHCNTLGFCLGHARETFEQCGSFVDQTDHGLHLSIPVWRGSETHDPDHSKRSAFLTCQAWHRWSNTVSWDFDKFRRIITELLNCINRNLGQVIRWPWQIDENTFNTLNLCGFSPSTLICWWSSDAN